MNKGLILDLGTGPGHLPVEIVKIAPEINIIGVDLSRRLIKVAGQTPREPVLLTS
jgi:methylase of polypeptide subunit release factors